MSARDTYIAAGLIGLALVVAALVLTGIARVIDPPPDAGSADASAPPAD